MEPKDLWGNLEEELKKPVPVHPDPRFHFVGFDGDRPFFLNEDHTEGAYLDESVSAPPQEIESVDLPPAWWERVNMALDIAKLRAIARGYPEARDQFGEVQEEIKRQLELLRKEGY